MPRIGNPDGLRNAAEQKKNDALERTDKAITQMVKEGKKINFHTVAEAAGLSVAYLYKYDSIKQRIDQLRKQQSPIKGLGQKPGASEDSRTAIITTFKERIKKQELEIKGLRDHIEATQGVAMQVPVLKHQIESLKSENLKLREELNECIRQSAETPYSEAVLTGEDSPVKHAPESWRSENSVRQTSPEVSSRRGSFQEVQPTSTPLADFKVISLNQKKANQSQDISDKIKLALAELGIKLSTTLTKTIKSASVEIVLSAIVALKEAMATGNIERPCGWLNSAIQDGWTKNEPQQQQTSTYKPIVCTVSEKSEEGLIDPEQIKELLKELKK